jgi:hypothetical protein
MKHQQFYESQGGEFVRQLYGGVTSTCGLFCSRSRDCWEGLTEEKNSENILDNSFSFFVPQT